MVFGTFDVLHPGHVHFFKQALKLAENPFLIVSIARDVSVAKVKGKPPLYSELQRQKSVVDTGLADRVVLGAVGDHIAHILEEEPDIIALGYDQSGYYVETTKEYFAKHNSRVRFVTLQPHRPEEFKSSIYKARMSPAG
jgi:FAD synthetase